MDRGLAGHALLACGSVALAFMAWTHPRLTGADDGVVVVAALADAVSEVQWQDEGIDVRVRREHGTVTVTTTRQAAGVAAAPATYPGSPQASALFAKLAPLTAARALGQLEPDKLKAFGLSPARGHLVLQEGATAHRLDIGHPAFGTGDYYCRSAAGAVYLLRATTLADLQHGAVGLQDHDAVGLARSAFDRVEIAFDGAHRTVVQRHGDAPMQAFFADPADPERRLDLLSGWINQVLQLRVVELAPPPSGPAAPPRLTVRFFLEHTEVGRITLQQTRAGAAAVGSSHRFGGPVAFARATVEALLQGAGAALADGT